MKPRGVAFLVVVVALGVTSQATTAAASPTLRCGDSITADTTLTVNLVDCSGDGLVIAADGVTLNLDGHHVDGRVAEDSVAIRVEGYHDVTIENGTISEFQEGVYALGARRLAIRHVRSVAEGHGGVLVDGGRGITIVGSIARRCGAGLIVTRSDGVQIIGNRVSDSTFGGIPVFESQRVLISGNAVTGSRTDLAIGLLRGSSKNAIVGNRVSRSADGIDLIEGSFDNLVAGNVVRATGGGVTVDVGTHDNRVLGNLVENTGFEGIAVVGSDGNLVAGNHVDRNGQFGPAAGIAVIRWPDDLSQTSDGNTISGNVALDDNGDGINVDRGQTGNLLRRNRADHNSELGIRAASGTIDGGGNRAAHNGDPRQCIGVVCV